MTSTLVRQSVVQSQGRGAVQDSSRERLVSPTLAENPRERRAYAFIHREQRCIDARSGQAFTAERRRPKTERGRARRELLPLHVCCATASIGLCSYRAARRRDHRFRDLPGHRSGHARRVRPLVPHALALRASAIPDHARARRGPDRRRVAHLARFVRSLRVAGPRHTGARDASQAPCRHRVLSLRPQSDLRRSHGVDRRPGPPVRECHGAGVPARSCGPDSSCSLSPTKSLRWASSSPTSTKRYRANVRRWLPRITPWRG